MLTKLKDTVQMWLVREARAVHALGLTPNSLSVLGILFAVSSTFVYFMWQGNGFLLVLASVLFLISGFCDALDGVLARIYGGVTVFGGFLDSLLDRYGDAFVLCGIMFGGLCSFFWGFLALVGSLLVSYVRAMAEAAGVKMESVGIAERAERIVILVAGSFVSVIWLEAFEWCVVLLAFLSNFTVFQRVFYFYRMTRGGGKSV